MGFVAYRSVVTFPWLVTVVVSGNLGRVCCKSLGCDITLVVASGNLGWFVESRSVVILPWLWLVSGTGNFGSVCCKSLGYDTASGLLCCKSLDF
jgi:hypothetical protein